MPESGYTIGGYVDLLSEFIDHLNVERISVAANCMGSAMLLLLAERRPDKFAALVAINPLTYRTARGGLVGWVLPLLGAFPRLSSAFARRVRIPGPLTRFVIVLQYGPRGWRRGLFHQLPGAAQAATGWSTRGRLVSMAEMFGDLEMFRYLDRMQPGPDFPPLAVVWGKANTALSPRAGRVLNRTLAPDRAEFLSGCGHLPMMEDPEAVTAIIDDFVSSQLQCEHRRVAVEPALHRLAGKGAKHDRAHRP